MGDSVDEKCIKHYVFKLKEEIKKQDDELKKYYNFFETLRCFLRIGHDNIIS